jgi:hypothetical protein
MVSYLTRPRALPPGTCAECSTNISVARSSVKTPAAALAATRSAATTPAGSASSARSAGVSSQPASIAGGGRTALAEPGAKERGVRGGKGGGVAWRAAAQTH